MTGHAIRTVLTGKVRPFRAPAEPSAIAKQPVTGPVTVGPLGLTGDEQADRVHHGGPDKALHHYPFDHYAPWRAALGDHPLLAAAGGFGENLSTLGLLESDVCIGDVFRLGTALVEVSQGRQPCWKLAHRFAVPTLVAAVVQTGRAGWYYRVREAGQVQAGDSVELVERSLPEWTVARCFALLLGGKGRAEPTALRALAGMDVLARPWRQRAAELLG